MRGCPRGIMTDINKSKALASPSLLRISLGSIALLLLRLACARLRRVAGHHF